MTQNNPKPIQQQPVANTVDLKKLFFMVLSNWYYFVIALIISSACAYFYLRYTLPVYKTSATLLIEEENSASPQGTNELLKGFGLEPGRKNLDNQIQILQSYTIVKETLEELPFALDYYIKGRVKTASLYPGNPIVVVPDSGSVLPYDLEFAFKLIDDNQYQLTIVDFDITTQARFGQRIHYKKVGSFTILPNPEYWSEDFQKKTIYFQFMEKDKLIESYRKRLLINIASEEGTIVALNIQGTNKEKDVDFLNRMITVFQHRNLDKKNEEAGRVIDFIDSQLIGITDSLMIAEQKLQEFRSRNRVMDVSAQGQQIIDQAVKLEDEKARLELESNYFEYLAKYLSSANTQETPIVPATMGISDPMLTQLVQELAELQSEYYSSNVGEKNPMKNHLLLKIKNVRQSLQETLKNVRHANTLAKNENKEQIRKLNAQATGLPSTERKLLGIEREFKLNDGLYTFLLQRRAEAQIQKASNTADNELVDPARTNSQPVSPQKKKIYSIAFLLGLGIPLSIILLIKQFDNKIASEEELKELTKLSIAGHIPHNEKKYQTVVLNDPHSNVSEAFRSLRTRMQFFTKDVKSPVILVTSSMPSEGKSFTSLNLASAYSLIGKKTVLVGFDLRRPKLYHDFELKNEKGVSTWLIGKDSMEAIVQPTAFPNLDLISAGPIPPNPGELASSEKIHAFVEALKKRYEYIIIDSAPIGTVSDSFTMASIVDATLLIVRHNKSMKSFVKNTVAETKANGTNGMSLLVNDLDTRNLSYRYAYSYAYGYGYKHERSINRKK